MSNEGNPGINKLANTLSDRMQVEADTPMVLDFGSINSNYSLQTNTFPVAIPKGEYTVCRQLTIGGTGSILTQTDESGAHSHDGGEHTHSGGEHEGHEDEEDGSHEHDGGEHTHDSTEGHSHQVLIPDKLRSLSPGDRVLVAWVQNEAVVIDIILSSASI